MNGDLAELIRQEVRRAQFHTVVALTVIFSVVLGIAFGIFALQLEGRMLEVRHEMTTQHQWMLATERRVSDAEHAVGDVLPRVELVLGRVTDRLEPIANPPEEP